MKASDSKVLTLEAQNQLLVAYAALQELEPTLYYLPSKTRAQKDVSIAAWSAFNELFRALNRISLAQLNAQLEREK